MSDTGTHNPWAEINGGMRGSTLLRLGAFVTFLAAIQNFGSGFLAEAPELLISSAWLTWVMSLWLIAAGFIWIAVHPFLGRFGLVVGLFHFFDGLYILLIVFAGMTPFLPPVSLSIGRTLLLLFFVLFEKRFLRSVTSIALVVIAMLQFLKISLRIMEVLPSWGHAADAGLDLSLLTLLAVTIFMVGGDIRRVENSWVRDLSANRTSGFEDFNNPEHNWNQPKD